MRDNLVAQAQRYVGCRCLAEDVLHDVLLRILASEALADIDSLEGYLSRMVRNLAIDKARRLGFESRTFIADPDDEWSGTAGGPCPAAAFQAHQALRIVEGALQELPERVTAAFRMHRIDGLAQKDVAHAMGVSRALVCEFIRRGHEHCLKALGSNPPERILLKRHGEKNQLPAGSASIPMCEQQRYGNSEGGRLSQRAGREHAVKSPKLGKNRKQGQNCITLGGERQDRRPARRADRLEQRQDNVSNR
jgi:RNA polymerase sigma factor (sigma-70 family)